MSEPKLTSANGQVVALAAHGFSAQLASVGATLVSLEHQGRPLVRAFDPQQPRPVFSGAILAPWPNRVTDGRYTWESAQLQLPITEPDRGHALHGLVVDTGFTLAQHGHDSAEFRTTITPSEGYPFEVELVIDYRLEPQGLRTTATATNLGAEAAPFGWGSHAYLVAPGGKADAWTLSLPAHEVQLTEGARLLPRQVVAVAGTELDFRAPRTLGTTFIDHAYTGLEFDGEKLARAVLTDEHGVGSQIIWDEACGWVQVHTADRDEPALNRTGLAIEPMTCPPGAFNSGQDVIRLEPAATHQASWLIGPVQANWAG
ncbi:aldose 1-epimerase family protein [Glutamicibacter sp. TV12E]|uniref:aldose 1-epimerase family protein n=1 Tax=Glutamicibacter sp. TV12E TaxID=3446362 RepID=UPI0040338DEF